MGKINLENFRDKLPFRKAQFNATSGKNKRKSPKKWIIITSVVLVVAVGFFAVRGFFGNKKMTSAPMVQVPVMRRDIVATITGTAMIQPKDQYSVTSLVAGEILSANFEEGDYVNKDDILYSIDASDIEKSIKSARLSVQKAEQNYADALKAKDKTTKNNQSNLESAELSVERAQRSYNEAQKTINNLTVESDISGVVGELYVKEGDNVSSGMNIARVYDDSSLKIEVPFVEEDAMQLSAGQAASVTVIGSGEVLSGTVVEVDTASEIKDGYMKVRNVTINVSSPGALSPSDKATVSVGDIHCNDVGVFEYLNEKTITAKASGTVEEINVDKGNMVYSGETIVTLTSDNALTTRDNAALSVQDAELSYGKAMEAMDDYSSDSQIKNAALALEDARINLDKLIESGDNYNITAPISGQVITKNAKAGDKIDNSNSQEEMAVIYDMSLLKFELMIDELDINKVSVGQKVKVTADALDSKEYTGYVQDVSIHGTATSGVTSYPVTVVIEDFDSDLLPGMNIDAEIEVGNAKGVLAVPKSAVSRDNVVYVVGEKEDVTDRAPEGYKSVTVETGLNDSNYIEIVSGLSEGDKVKIENSSGNSNMFPMGMPMGGMPGGGVPGGGMSGGGMSGGVRAGGGMTR